MPQIYLGKSPEGDQNFDLKWANRHGLIAREIIRGVLGSMKR